MIVVSEKPVNVFTNISSNCYMSYRVNILRVLWEGNLNIFIFSCRRQHLTTTAMWNTKMNNFQQREDDCDDVLCYKDGLTFFIVHEHQHANDQERQIYSENFNRLRSKDVLKRVLGSQRSRTLFSAICHGYRKKLIHTTDIIASRCFFGNVEFVFFVVQNMSSISTASNRSIAIWTDNFATSSLFPSESNESLAVFTKSRRRWGVVQSTIFKACGVRELSFSISSRTNPNILKTFESKPAHM